MVKNPPATQKAWVRSLGGEGSPEEEMTTHRNIFAWRIPWTEEPVWPQSMGSQSVGHDGSHLAVVRGRTWRAG